MKIQAICATSIALVTNLEELSSRGICAQSINSQGTADIIRQSFSELGLKTEGAIDVETYINGQAVLIFARIVKEPDDIELLCLFEDFEHLISAVPHLHDRLPATLISYKRAYYLAIHSSDEHITAELLSEYAYIEPNPKLRYAHLREHGKVLCHGNTIKTIRESFYPNLRASTFFADSLTASE